MTCYAVVSPDGVIRRFGQLQARVDKAAFLAKTAGAVSVTEAQLSQMRGGGRWKWVDGLLEQAAPPVEPVDQVRARASRRIDREAEAHRLKFLTPGSGQAAEYEATVAEATRAIVAPDPLVAEAYPWLAAEQTAQAEAGVSMTLREVASGALARRAAWNAAGPGIKAVRRGAKLRVAAETDPAEIAAIVQGLVWPTPE